MLLRLPLKQVSKMEYAGAFAYLVDMIFTKACLSAAYMDIGSRVITVPESIRVGTLYVAAAKPNGLPDTVIAVSLRKYKLGFFESVSIGVNL